MDELLLIARQYRRMERDNIADRRFVIQLPRYLPSLFVQDTRARTEHRWITAPYCCRVDEPVNLSIEIAEPQFELSPPGIRHAWETFPFIVKSTHVFSNHAWMPHPRLQPGKYCA